eukprot:4711784-Lingulodinium_polyedra.AAC.1
MPRPSPGVFFFFCGHGIPAARPGAAARPPGTAAATARGLQSGCGRVPAASAGQRARGSDLGP